MKSTKQNLKDLMNLPVLMSNLETVKELCSILFIDELTGKPLTITKYQSKIIQAIFFKRKRVVCIAPTRAGKSLAVAIGAILLGAYKSGEKIRIVSFTEKTTKIIMGYIITHILDNELLYNSLMYDVKDMGIERIKKEFSKNRITWEHNSEVMTLTANVSGGGSSLIGWGATTLIVDEAEQMPKELVDTKIMRMLGDTQDSSVFMISNPEIRGFMYDKHNNPDWEFLKITWQECVKENRFSQEFIDERRGSLTKREFKIWYEPDWPEEDSDDLFTKKAIDNMFAPLTNEELELLKTNPDRKQLGVDVARFGVDLTVLMPCYIYGDKKFIMDCYVYEKKDTVYTMGKIKELHQQNTYNRINIDDNGLGGGITDMLRNQDDIAGVTYPFIASGMDKWISNDDKIRYANNKSVFFQRFVKDAEDGNVRVVMQNHRTDLFTELKKMKYKYNISGKLLIVDPEDKSPDFADACNISMYSGFEFVATFV